MASGPTSLGFRPPAGTIGLRLNDLLPLPDMGQRRFHG